MNYKTISAEVMLSLKYISIFYSKVCKNYKKLEHRYKSIRMYLELICMQQVCPSHYIVKIILGIAKCVWKFSFECFI